MRSRKKNNRRDGSRGPSTGGDRQRRQLAELAARLMVDGGIRDFAVAKAKAADRLGVVDGLPSNRDIEQALIEYQALFRAGEHEDELRRLRNTAREAMGFFAEFDPCLTGAVLSGSAGPHSPVELHLFADLPESVGMFLDDQRFPYETDEKRFKDGRGGYQFFPVYRFVADETPIEVVVFPSLGRRQSPPSLVDGRPMERADLMRLEQLLRA